MDAKMKENFASRPGLKLLPCLLYSFNFLYQYLLKYIYMRRFLKVYKRFCWTVLHLKIVTYELKSSICISYFKLTFAVYTAEQQQFLSIHILN